MTDDVGCEAAGRPGLAAPVQGWLRRVRDSVPPTHQAEARPEGYPDNVKDRLLYVLTPHGAQVRIDICKGRINAAGRRAEQVDPAL